MPEREDPAECAQNGTTTPAVGRATALHGAHAFNEPADDCEQQVQPQDTAKQAHHEANGRRLRPGHKKRSIQVLTSGLVSTIVDGMEDATELAGRAAATDPKVGLAAVGALRGLLEQLEALQVDHARGQGWSWAAIACELGVTKQAVHRKHAPRLRLLRRS